MTEKEIKERLEYFGNLTIHCGDKTVHFLKPSIKTIGIKINKVCTKCGTKKNLKEYSTAWFRTSEKSNPNIMKYRNGYVCKDCERLAVKLLELK